MAVLSGNAGSIRLSANVIAEMDTWSLDVSTGLEETQAFSDTWKDRHHPRLERHGRGPF